MTADPSPDRLFQSILSQDNVFYKAQARSEPDLKDDQKLEILATLFATKPAIFLQRYHRHVSPCFIPLFDASDYVIDYYIKEIIHRIESKIPGTSAATAEKNKRFLQLEALKKDGKYFSNEKMRERNPAAFDMMVGQFLDDEEKLNLRPTVDRPAGSWSKMLAEFDDAGRTSARRKRQLMSDWDCGADNSSRFLAHAGARMSAFDDLETVQGLDDADEADLRSTYPKHCATGDVDAIMKKFRKADISSPAKTATPPEAETQASKHWGEILVEETPASKHWVENLIEDAPANSFRKQPKDDDDDIKFEAGTGEVDSDDEAITFAPDETFPKELLRAEFTSHMEQAFLNGDDSEFFDYDSSAAIEQFDRIRERDLEDAYFDDD
uniref:CCD97-like_C domain-containing protein n=1 Tax=Panagrellus redivivus TaxID=6233 RepID=A0A7E4VY40_PANRE